MKVPHQTVVGVSNNSDGSELEIYFLLPQFSYFQFYASFQSVISKKNS